MLSFKFQILDLEEWFDIFLFSQLGERLIFPFFNFMKIRIESRLLGSLAWYRQRGGSPSSTEVTCIKNGSRWACVQRLSHESLEALFDSLTQLFHFHSFYFVLFLETCYICWEITFFSFFQSKKPEITELLYALIKYRCQMIPWKGSNSKTALIPALASIRIFLKIH